MAGQDAWTLAKYALSPVPLRRAVGVAVLNALSAQAMAHHGIPGGQAVSGLDALAAVFESSKSDRICKKMNELIAQTPRTKLKRLPKRGNFERASVYKILDEAFICHVGFCVDGQPFVIPTSFGRIDDRLVIHGSAASRMMRALSEEIEVCVTVTLIDGLV